jgi:hypothetical protein
LIGLIELSNVRCLDTSETAEIGEEAAKGQMICINFHRELEKAKGRRGRWRETANDVNRVATIGSYSDRKSSQ